MYERFFQIDSIKYRFLVHPYFEVAFEIIGGKTKGGQALPRVNMWGDVFNTHALEDCHAPFRVLKKVAELTLGYISEKKPDYLVINSLSNQKRSRVYQKLIQKYLPRIKGYELSFFEHDVLYSYILICKVKDGSRVVVE
ncbi:MAG TPA: hypothetical protein PKA63_13880 [Oligoflexia bacterium]|nr:hypothetical protein [Oligoflexia bacterium]HMP49753.1 hypothetical protein [Oligoflexia bacterium]